MKRFLTAFAILFFMINGHAQDTLKVEPSIYYSSAEHADTRSFYGYVQYAREDIVYTDSLRSIQYCYYMDSVRHCMESVYQLKDDDVLLVSNYRDTIAWNYKRRSDSLYEISAFIDGFYQYGLARSLHPLLFFNKQVTTTSDKIDTLWSIEYVYSPHDPEGYATYALHKKNIEGKVYTNKQCSLQPRLQNGAVFTELTWILGELGYNDPYYFVRRTVFIVTAEGRIANVSEMGNLEWSSAAVCIDFLKQVYRYSPLLPATRKSKPVNVQWEVSVKMEN